MCVIQNVETASCYPQQWPLSPSSLITLPILAQRASSTRSYLKEERTCKLTIIMTAHFTPKGNGENQLLSGSCCPVHSSLDSHWSLTQNSKS